MVCPPPDTGELEELFRHEVFKMLKAEGNITDVVIEKTWEFKGLVRPKLAQYVVIRTNLIGDHIYCPLFATIQNPFCNTAFLKPHMLFPIFS